jgi:hypothetical protein
MPIKSNAIPYARERKEGYYTRLGEKLSISDKTRKLGRDK